MVMMIMIMIYKAVIYSNPIFVTNLCDFDKLFYISKP